MRLDFILSTDRLLIEPLSINDSSFIFELLNSEGWIKFIGNRNIKTNADATTYIQNILANENVHYWVAKLKDSKALVGIITFIKREYLEHHDIGFAFLPAVSKKGFAYEAVMAVLNQIMKAQGVSQILATTIPENSSSIKLLNKIGLVFKEEIEVDNEIIHVYEISKDELQKNICTKH